MKSTSRNVLKDFQMRINIQGKNPKLNTLFKFYTNVDYKYD